MGAVRVLFGTSGQNTWLHIPCFKLIEVNTKEGEEKVKAVKITTSEHFAARCMDKKYCL